MYNNFYNITMMMTIGLWFFYGVSIFIKNKKITKVDFALTWGTLLLTLVTKLVETLKFTP